MWIKYDEKYWKNTTGDAYQGIAMAQPFLVVVLPGSSDGGLQSTMIIVMKFLIIVLSQQRSGFTDSSDFLKVVDH